MVTSASQCPPDRQVKPSEGVLQLAEDAVTNPSILRGCPASALMSSAGQPKYLQSLPTPFRHFSPQRLQATHANSGLHWTLVTTPWSCSSQLQEACSSRLINTCLSWLLGASQHWQRGQAGGDAREGASKDLYHVERSLHNRWQKCEYSTLFYSNYHVYLIFFPSLWWNLTHISWGPFLESSEFIQPSGGGPRTWRPTHPKIKLLQGSKGRNTHFAVNSKGSSTKACFMAQGKGLPSHQGQRQRVHLSAAWPASQASDLGQPRTLLQSSAISVTHCVHPDYKDHGLNLTSGCKRAWPHQVVPAAAYWG